MPDDRQVLVDACHILGREGHEHFHLGHASVRDGPGGDRFWVKRTGLGLAEVEVDDLVLLDFEGRRIAGDGPIHQEMPLHAEIYRQRPDVGAIVHTHPPYAAALSATEAPFRVVSQDSLPFASGLARFDSARLIATDELGRAVAAALGERSIVLLRNHGITVVGGSVPEVVYLAVAFERSVRAQAIANSLGTIREIPSDEIEAMTAELVETGPARAEAVFEYLRRTRVDRGR
jgi:L-fuculose-phosphate aldolase